MSRAAAVMRRHRRGAIAIAIACCAGALIAWGCYLAWPPLGFVSGGALLGSLLLVDLEQPGSGTR